MRQARSFSFALHRGAPARRDASSGHDDAKEARTIRSAAHGVVGGAWDADDAAGAIARVVDPQLTFGDDEHLAFVVLVHGQSSIAWFSVAALLGIIVLFNVGRWYQRSGAARPRARGAASTRHPALSQRQVGVAPGSRVCSAPRAKSARCAAPGTQKFPSRVPIAPRVAVLPLFTMSNSVAH